MNTPVALACVAFVLCGSMPARSGEADEMLLPVEAFLCETAGQAIQFADIRAKGEPEEIAQDRVGRVAGGEVCGLYSGIASVQSEDVTLHDGVAYKVTAYRFNADRRTAWLAERSFAPFRQANHQADL